VTSLTRDNYSSSLSIIFFIPKPVIISRIVEKENKKIKKSPTKKE